MEEGTTPQPAPNKNYYYIIGVMGVLAILVGVYAFKNQPKTEKTMPVIESPVVDKEIISEVKYTSSGFSPASLAVKKGMTVKFVNKSSTPMWVASAPHPTHTDYPEFDQKASGDSFIFPFDKVGSWKYHNHAPFSPGGMIIVTE